MEIIVSGKSSSDQQQSVREAVKLLVNFLNNTGIESIIAPLDTIVFFPVIISPEFSIPKKNFRSYSKKENAEFINIIISYDIWCKSEINEQFDLLFEALMEAIKKTKSSKIPDDIKHELIDRLRKVKSD